MCSPYYLKMLQFVFYNNLFGHESFHPKYVIVLSSSKFFSGDVSYEEPYSQPPYRPHSSDYNPKPPTYNRPAPTPEPYKPPPQPEQYYPPPSQYNPQKLYPAPPNYSPSPVQPTYSTEPPPPTQYSPPYSSDSYSTNYGKPSQNQGYTYPQPSAPDYPANNYTPTKAPYNPNPSNYVEPNYYAPPSSYTTETVVPPAYNLDFLTPDPNQNFPGPDIYDNNSIQGPSPNNNYFLDKIDNGDNSQYNAGYNNNNNQVDYGYNSNQNDYGYNNQQQQQSYDMYDKNRYQEVINNKLSSSYQPKPPVQPPKRPNGPDYTSSTTVLSNPNSIVRDSIPMRVGIDLYPMSDEGLLGKYGTFGLTGENKHEVLLHLNLFSKKPDNFGGRQENLEISHSFGPFSLGRLDTVLVLIRYTAYCP